MEYATATNLTYLLSANIEITEKIVHHCKLGANTAPQS
jgi:hypothetical protein